MTDPRTVVQPVVRLRAESLGGSGRAWLRELPALVRDLELQWAIRVEESLTGGTAAYLGRARTQEGLPAVVKVAVPDPDLGDEAGTLARADGHGYVRLLAADPVRDAMLLEMLGPAMPHSGSAPETQLATLRRLLAQAWQVPAPSSGSHTEPYDKATALSRLVSRLQDELGRPVPDQVVDRALSFAERRAGWFTPDRCAWVHGDAASANALQVLVPRPGAESGYVFVDPDGFLGDPAYDLGVALRDWTRELLAASDPGALARRYCAVLATGSGFDPQEVWEWGYLERVSTGLYALAMGAEDLARPFFTTAELLQRA